MTHFKNTFRASPLGIARDGSGWPGIARDRPRSSGIVRGRRDGRDDSVTVGLTVVTVMTRHIFSRHGLGPFGDFNEGRRKPRSVADKGLQKANSTSPEHHLQCAAIRHSKNMSKIFVNTGENEVICRHPLGMARDDSGTLGVRGDLRDARGRQNS